MQGRSTQNIVNYTTVPTGLLIDGKLWTGQATACTARCPKCGRVGVESVRHNSSLVVVHTGRVNGNILEGIDYCTLELH